ncbi:MAG: hypothetical protein KBF76_07215 [Verrucomicrobiales bacterium]|jgi:ElaB/YqjD/DUF883 family membrane-anchored ribosome-binding protein|nr:hypothetical protein [Verrucomicrobiales bacterium]HQZ26605.1 hypothetical protein [Verrucomicrobiales bacterium]
MKNTTIEKTKSSRRTKKADNEKIAAPKSRSKSKVLSSNLKKTGQEVKKATKEVAEKTSEAARNRADSLVNSTSAKIREVQLVALEAAEKLEDTQPRVVVHSLAYLSDQVGNVADYFESNNVLDILDDTRSVVKKHPVATIGILALAGIAAGRYLKAGEGDV